MNLARKYSNARDYWEDRVENNRQYDLKKQAIESRDAKNLQKTKNKGTLKATEMRQQAATKRTGMTQAGATKRTGMQQKTSMAQHKDTLAAERKKNRQEQIKELMGGQTDVDGYVIPGTRKTWSEADKILRFRQRAMEEKMGQGQLQDSDDQDNFRTWTDDQGVKHFSNLKPGTGGMRDAAAGGGKPDGALKQSNVFKEGRRLDNDSNDAAYFMSLFDAGKTNAQTGSKKQKKQKRLVGRDKNGNPIYQYGPPEKSRELNWSEIPGVKQITDQVKKIHDLRSIN